MLGAIQVAFAPEGLFDIFEKVLLLTDDAARSTNAHPADNFFGRELVVLHEEGADERSGSAKASFTVDTEGAFGLFGDVEEFFENAGWRVRAIEIVEIGEVGTDRSEFRSLVVRFVEANDERDVLLDKVWDEVFGRKGSVAVGVASRRVGIIVGPSKREYFALYDPVEIAVLDCFEVLVFGQVEAIEIEEAMTPRFVESSQAVEDVYAKKGARSRSRVVKGLEVEILDASIRVVWRKSQVQQFPGSDQKCSVGSLVWMSRRIEVDRLVAEDPHFLVESAAKAIQLPKVERTKIEKKVPIQQLVVDREPVAVRRKWIWQLGHRYVHQTIAHDDARVVPAATSHSLPHEGVTE